jgi:hypothetical protein
VEAAHIDFKASAAGFVVVAPNALCDNAIDSCRWAQTGTPLDPGYVTDDQLLGQQNEMRFFVDAIRCARQLVEAQPVPMQNRLSGDVYALGFSQGAKLVTRFGCQGYAISGGALTVRAVAAAAAILADTVNIQRCANSAADNAPPPLLLFMARSGSGP